MADFRASHWILIVVILILTIDIDESILFADWERCFFFCSSVLDFLDLPHAPRGTGMPAHKMYSASERCDCLGGLF